MMYNIFFLVSRIWNQFFYTFNYLRVDCEGSQICEHKKRKYFCKDCGGSQICKHKKVKSNCKLCIVEKNNNISKNL